MSTLTYTQSPASFLAAEDHVRKMLQKSGEIPQKNYAKYLPRNKHSPFGDFPEGYTIPKPATLPSNESQVSQQNPNPFATATSFTRKGRGSGGKTSSLKKAPEQPAQPPPKAGAYNRRFIRPSEFRRFYDRGDLPVSVGHATGSKIIWKVTVEQLDYHHYLPIFFDGLREKHDPYRHLAIQGTFEMLEKGGSKVLPVIPQVIIPIKTALNSRDPDVICVMLKMLQKLVSCGDMIGEALVPYYRQILPVLNIFKQRNVNLGDKIDYSQRKRQNMGELIQETLEVFEQTGGEDAFINIKYMIPTYESCVLN
jgi:hypothetical protein